MSTYFQSSDLVAIIVAFISLAGVLFTAVISLKTKRDTKGIANAVNHRLPGELRLYDLAVENHVGLSRLNSRVGSVERKLDVHITTPHQCPYCNKTHDLSEHIREKSLLVT